VRMYASFWLSCIHPVRLCIMSRAAIKLHDTAKSALRTTLLPDTEELTCFICARQPSESWLQFHWDLLCFAHPSPHHLSSRDDVS
jgi:hypothetical protein